MQILEEHLSQRHPELLVCHKIWRREISQGVGAAMNIGVGQKSETRQMANSYLATMTKDQQRRAYAESRMDKASKLDYFNELKDSLHLTGSKYRPGMPLNYSAKKDFLFDPTAESP